MADGPKNSSSVSEVPEADVNLLLSISVPEQSMFCFGSKQSLVPNASDSVPSARVESNAHPAKRQKGSDNDSDAVAKRHAAQEIVLDLGSWRPQKALLLSTENCSMDNALAAQSEPLLARVYELIMNSFFTQLKSAVGDCGPLDHTRRLGVLKQCLRIASDKNGIEIAKIESVYNRELSAYHDNFYSVTCQKNECAPAVFTAYHGTSVRVCLTCATPLHAI